MVEILETERQLKVDKSSWTLVKLGGLAEDISKRVDNPAQSGYDRFVGLEHFESGELIIKRWGTTKNLTSAAKEFNKGDILFARRNAYLRRASLIDFDGICSGDAFVIREKHDRVVPGFLVFVLNTDALWDYANSNAAGTMSKRVKWRDLANYEFLLPPKEQQAQLCEMLWALNDALQKQMELHSKLKIYLMSFRSNFIGDLRDNRNKIVQIKDVGTKRKQAVQVGPFGGSVNSRHFVSSGVPVIKINNLNEEGELDLSKMVYISQEHAASLDRYRIENGDILTAAQATTGRSAIADYRIKDAIISQHLIRISVDDSLCYPEYLFEVFSSSLIKNQINLVKEKTTRDGLNTDDVAHFRFPLPELSQQHNFIEKVVEIRESINACQTHLIRCKTMLKSLLNSIFKNVI